MQAIWEQLTATGNSATFTFRVKRPSPTKGNVWVQGSALTLKDSSQNTKSVVWILNDITDQKEMAEQAINRAQLAESLSAQMSIFRHMFDMVSSLM